jgi:hypothetical protein
MTGRTRSLRLAAARLVVAAALACAAPRARAAGEAPADSLPAPDSARVVFTTTAWRSTPFGERLLTDPAQWREAVWHHQRVQPLLDYNRVDPMRLGLQWEAQASQTMLPRLGARVEYATGRERWLYGVQLEQPLLARGQVALGVAMVRRTDHNDLQQVEDAENSLALLFGRQDYRDYFEREGFGAYLAWRLPDRSIASVHVRNDDYRSLALWEGTRSWMFPDRTLRANPPVAEGEIRALLVRFERVAYRTERTRAGFYHWIEAERAGGALGGIARYTRLLGDVRSVLRLSPATTLTLRGVAGHTADGTLPPQKQFVAGGVDGLRAHMFDAFRGDQVLLGQAEYDIGLWQLRTSAFEGGLHALAFLDTGRAWRGRFDPGGQHFAADGGFGVGTSEDNMRVYFARNLQQPRSNFVVSVRLQRPF